jgi:predicted nucleotidyltransferase
MPVKSLNSSVLKWPDQGQVEQAVKQWAGQEAPRHTELIRLGYFGSYARGNWGVGSDLDLIAVVRDTDEPFERRALTWNLTSLPVPAELLVYTQAEWEQLQASGGRFAQILNREVVWLNISQ